MKTASVSCILRFAFLPALTIGMLAMFEKNANGDLVVEISDTTDGIEFSWTGFIDTSGLTLAGSPFSSSGGIRTSGNTVFAGSISDLDWYQNVVTGPSDIGTAAFSFYPNSSTGDLFVLHMGFGGSFAVPDNYVSGATITGSTEFTGTSITDLGLTKGAEHVYTIAGSPSTITLKVIPEPSALALLGVAGLGLVVRRRRKR